MRRGVQTAEEALQLFKTIEETFAKGFFYGESHGETVGNTGHVSYIAIEDQQFLLGKSW